MAGYAIGCIMSLINNSRHFPTKASTPRRILLLCGFGGAIWQTRRLVGVLNRAGYDVTALDFPKRVLSEGDPALLPELVNEVVAFAENEARKGEDEILLVGISLGALISLNILRRSAHFSKAVMITGGNIATVAQNIYGDSWPQSLAELSVLWKSVNMFSEPGEWQGKRALFVLPAKDKLIDTAEVIEEINKQTRAGNTITLIRRGSLGHVGTIIEETIIFPRRTLEYLRKLEDSPV